MADEGPSSPYAGEDRQGPLIRSLAQTLMTLLRTADDGLEMFREMRVGEHTPLTLERLRRLRDLLDAMAYGLKHDDDEIFWQRLEQAWSLIYSAAAGAMLPGTAPAVPSQPTAQPPVASPPQVAPPPIVVPPVEVTAPPVAPPVVPEYPNERDFRQALAGPGKAATAPQPTSDDHRPFIERMAPGGATPKAPQPDQQHTMPRTLTQGRMAAEAVNEALAWPLERYAELSAELARQPEAVMQVAERFGLADRFSLDFVVKKWQQRLADDEQLRQQHAELVAGYAKED